MSIAYPKVKPSAAEIKKHIELAKRRIHSAELCFNGKEYRDAVPRAYYAFFDAATALLLT